MSVFLLSFANYNIYQSKVDEFVPILDILQLKIDNKFIFNKKIFYLTIPMPKRMFIYSLSIFIFTNIEDFPEYIIQNQCQQRKQP